MKVHFSIIIPIYNAANTLSATLESISAQTYPCIEVICINDGSTDRSEKIVSQWKDKKPEIDLTLLNQENRGLGNARNRGIKKAKHPWVAFLDADDIWLPGKLSEVANYLSKNQADVIYHGFITFGGKRTRTRSIFPIHSIEDLLIKGNPIIPSATAVRTALLLEFPFAEDQNIHGAEDFDLWLRLLHAGKTFKLLRAHLTQYRETGGMSSRISEHLRHVMNVIAKYHELRWFDAAVFQKATHRKNWEAGRFYHKNGQFENALSQYTKAGVLTPKQKLIQALAKLKIIG